jgi:hypothetical protein
MIIQTFCLATMLIQCPKENHSLYFVKMASVEVTPSQTHASIFQNNVINCLEYSLMCGGCLPRDIDAAKGYTCENPGPSLAKDLKEERAGLELEHTCVVDTIDGGHLEFKVIDYPFEGHIALNILCFPKAPATFLCHANDNINIATITIGHWIVLFVYRNVTVCQVNHPSNVMRLDRERLVLGFFE